MFRRVFAVCAPVVVVTASPDETVGVPSLGGLAEQLAMLQSTVRRAVTTTGTCMWQELDEQQRRHFLSSGVWESDECLRNGFESMDDVVIPYKARSSSDNVPEFCDINHHPRKNVCEPCSQSTFANGSARPHLLFLHMPKTGGSSLECATKDTLSALGIWTNMGHTEQDRVDHCLEVCSAAHSSVKTVMTARDPYAFYRSYFLYQGPWFKGSSPHSAGFMKQNTTFSEYMRVVQNRYANKRGTMTQAGTLQTFLGNGAPDYTLRTESLDDDFAAMLGALRLPLLELPRKNTADEFVLSPPPTHFDKDIIDFINKAEDRIFTLFGYEKKTEPFDLN